jgi:hypothetical protein
LSAAAGRIHDHARMAGGAEDDQRFHC